MIYCDVSTEDVAMGKYLIKFNRLLRYQTMCDSSPV